MRSFVKKLACAVAGASMIFTMFAPAQSAKAADETFALNRNEQILYVNKGASYNKQSYDFNFKTKPADFGTNYTCDWATSDEKIATVAKGGVVTAVGVGKATITCSVTNKETGKVTPVTADVTVKANAAKVEITNAAENDGKIVKADTVIDLDRAMYDAAGNKTTKRGTLVTDYTKWVVVPAEAATIDQSTGKITFTEKATGDVKIYCYTYQSNKHPEAVATSEAITVTANPTNEFTIKQNTAKTFTINFDSAVKAVGNVQVDRLFTTADDTYMYPMVVNKVTLAKDGMSAVVELFSVLLNEVNYLIKVDGYEDYTLTASNGAPATMTISAAADALTPFVKAGAETQLHYRLYDANGVDVTTGSESVLFNVKDFSTDGSYYVAGDKIWFVKAGLSTVVVAEYQSGKFDNGVQVGNITATFAFQSVEDAPAAFQGVVNSTIAGWDKPTMNVAKGDLANLQIKVKVSNVNDPIIINQNDQLIDGIGNITFETVSQDNVILNLADLSLILCKVGPATIIVNLETSDATGNITKTPVGRVTVNVTEPRSLYNVTVDKPSVTVGSVAGFSTETIKVSAKDQYGADVAITSIDISGANSVADEVKSGISVDVANKSITADGTVLASAIKSGTGIQLTFKAKINNSKEVNFNVLVKKDTGVAASNYISIEASGFGDAARTVVSTNAKSANIKVYQMNNGIKVAEQAVEAYRTVTAADENKYFFKVLKNGNDVTANVQAVSNGAVINFSKQDAVSNGAVSGSVVNYNLGAGTYSFNLYKCIKSGSNLILVQQQVSNGVETCNAGSYSAATRIKETTLSTSQKDLRDCFSIKDTKGAEATSAFVVNVDPASLADGSPYVYVSSIDFYDDLGKGEYAKYTVNIGVSLKKKFLKENHQ